MNSDLKIIEIDIKSDAFEGKLRELSEAHNNSYLSLIYPTKIVKRFIFRPYLGRWYPYIDVKSPGYDTQLSLFFGKVNIKFSVERACSFCGTMLNDSIQKKSFLPVSLCSKCFQMLYYGYWNCLKAIYNFTTLKPVESINLRTDFLCENLLMPKCGYLIESERTNPCLRNHAIGIEMVDDSTFKIILGQLDEVKYQMIWEGSLFGLIIGYSNRIMNLEVLRDLIRDFHDVIKGCIVEFNNHPKSYEFSSSNSYFGEYQVKLADDYSNSKDSINVQTISQWILLNFLRYYKNYEIQRFIDIYLERPLSFLSLLVEKVMRRLNLEVLQFVKGYKSFTPFSCELRQYLEDIFKNIFKIKEFRDFSIKKVKSSLDLTYCDILKAFAQSMPLIKFEDLESKQLELREIMGSLGSTLIVNSNLSNYPMLLNATNLIGRNMF